MGRAACTEPASVGAGLGGGLAVRTRLGVGRGREEGRRWGPAASCTAVKKGFYAESRCETREEKKGKPKGKFEKAPGPGYTATSATVTLQTPGLPGSTVTCTGSTATGEVTGPKTGLERITFTGCEAAGEKCSSEGSDATPSGKAGVIVTNLLQVRLLGPVSGQVWTQLQSAEHEPFAMEFGCEGSLLRTIGSLAGIQAGNVNVSSHASTTTFASAAGEHALYSGLSENDGTGWAGPDPAGATFTASNNAASATEIKG